MKISKIIKQLQLSKVFQTGLQSSRYWRGMAHSLWGTGLRVKPTAGVRSSSSSVTPGGGVKRNRCKRDVKKRKISILARPSPRHILRPERTERFTEPKNSWSILGSSSVMPKWLYLQKTAWRHLSWGIYHPCPGSERGWRCVGSPTHSHHTGQRPEEETQSSPEPRNKRAVLAWAKRCLQQCCGLNCFILLTELLWLCWF